MLCIGTVEKETVVTVGESTAFDEPLPLRGHFRLMVARGHSIDRQ